jgi:hypothetical protein
MAKFIQIIEYKTSKIDEVQALADKWLAATEGRRTASDGTVTEDRDARGTYLEIIEFPSYEAAMKNSELPETQEIAAQLTALCDGPPTFRNLDVVRDDVI